MTISLLTDDRQHLGFLLCHLDGPGGGSCSFSVVPSQASLFEHPAALRLFRRREVGESRFEMRIGGGRSISIESPGLPRMRIELDEEGRGTWGEGDGELFMVVGAASYRGEPGS